MGSFALNSASPAPHWAVVSNTRPSNITTPGVSRCSWTTLSSAVTSVSWMVKKRTFPISSCASPHASIRGRPRIPLEAMLCRPEGHHIHIKAAGRWKRRWKHHLLKLHKAGGFPGLLNLRPIDAMQRLQEHREVGGFVNHSSQPRSRFQPILCRHSVLGHLRGRNPKRHPFKNWLRTRFCRFRMIIPNMSRV